MRFVKFGKVNRDFAEKLFLSKNNLGKFADCKICKFRPTGVNISFETV